jgi:hypothetical protein
VGEECGKHVFEVPLDEGHVVRLGLTPRLHLQTTQRDRDTEGKERTERGKKETSQHWIYQGD